MAHQTATGTTKRNEDKREPGVVKKPGGTRRPQANKDDSHRSKKTLPEEFPPVRFEWS
jgi:hypothetical protein